MTHAHLCTAFHAGSFRKIQVRTVVQLIESTILIRNMSAVSHHPDGIQVEIVGIEEGNRGRSCEQHQ